METCVSNIKSWAPDDRPREKALLHGFQALSMSELLAILIHKGTYKRSAVDLGKEIIALCHNNLNELGKLTIQDFIRIKGIGPAKAIIIATAIELGKRRQTSELVQYEQVKSPVDMAKFLQIQLKDFTREVFAVVFLNKSNKIKKFEIISHGGLTETIVDVRVIFRKALEYGATQIILCHNHPSGSLHPSQADKNITRRIKESAAIMNIHLLDHFIISDAGYFSFSNAGIL